MFNTDLYSIMKVLVHVRVSLVPYYVSFPPPLSLLGIILNLGAFLNNHFLPLPLPKSSSGALPLGLRFLDIALTEAETRMECVEDQDRNDDHHTLKHNEQCLILDQRTVPPLSKLYNTVDRADEDADSRECKSDEEKTELHATPEGRAGGIERGFAHAVHTHDGPNGEVGAEEHEDQEGEDLDGETRYHDVIAGFGVLV